MYPDDLVRLDNSILGYNHYFRNCKRLGFTKEQLAAAGLTDDIVRVHKIINPILVEIDKALRKSKVRLLVKEGYRSKEVYKIAYDRIVRLNSKKTADSLFNLKDMPHTSGKSIDAVLAEENGKEIFLRNGGDGFKALFVDFYKAKKDKMSKKYQLRQELLINTMQNHGFRLGSKREYFHFDYKPNIRKNY